MFKQFRIVLSLSFLALAVLAATRTKSSVAATPKPGPSGYHLIKTIPVAGDEGWDYLAALLESLVKSPTPGHQYLTSYPNEDAIVVVSKGEYGDELLTGELGT